MAARLASGRISRDWWQRRAPKNEPERVQFRLNRIAWLLRHRWGRYYFDILYERDPVLWAPWRSATRPRQLLLDRSVRPAALKTLYQIRRGLAWYTQLVDEAIARNEAARDSEGSAWLRRQLEGLGKEGG